MMFLDTKPIYQQIKEIVLLKIFGGEYFHGYKLPSIREFAAQMQVNAKTIVQTYDALEQSGLIFTDSTNGKFVTRDGALIEMEKQAFLSAAADEFLRTAKALGLSKKQIEEIIDGKNI